MNTPKLSILIPTYNRARYLTGCLENIINSAKGFEKYIEIIVSDNASSDDTTAVVNKFKKQYPFINYQRNNENIGCECNIYYLTQIAAGEYLWVFGDDDVMRKEAIECVLKRINSDNISLIVVNFSIMSKDLKKTITNYYYKCSGFSSLTDHNVLLKKYGISLGYISSVIIKKDLFNTVPKKYYEKYLEYGFSFLVAAYLAVLNNCIIGYIQNPIFYNRSSNSLISDWCKVFVEGSALVLAELENLGFSKEAVKSAKNKTIKDYVFKQIVSTKAEKQIREYGNIYDALSKYYKDCWMYWLCCLPMKYIPDVFLRLTKNIKNRLAGIQ